MNTNTMEIELNEIDMDAFESDYKWQYKILVDFLKKGRKKIIFLDFRNLLKVQGLIFIGPLIPVLLAEKYDLSSDLNSV